MPNPSVVTVAPTAVVTMMLHAAKHVHDPVHGVLMGFYNEGGGSSSSSSSKLTVTKAIPVCHGAPTHPLVETALALIESSDNNNNGDDDAANNNKTIIVGWYVSPRLLKDERPGPAALKIVSSLGGGKDSNNEPALLVVRNDGLAALLSSSGEEEGQESTLDSSSLLIKAYGKDFGKQWLEPLSLSFSNPSGTVKAVQSAFTQNIPVMDLVDHFEEGDPKTSKWPHNDALTRFVTQQQSSS